MVRARRTASQRADPPAPTIRDDTRADDTGARDRILDAAEDLIAESGFDATPTARIAERAGVAKGLLFYYFPRKADVLKALFAERLPAHPLCTVSAVVVKGDVSGSLVRLAHRLDLTGHPSRVMRAILFREAGTHTDVARHLGALHAGLLELTEDVLDAASPRKLDQRKRRQAAGTYVAVLLQHANAHRYNGPLPDLAGAADLISRALLA
jgi:AcrR family transcriptional regulator